MKKDMQKIDEGIYLKKDKLFRYRLVHPIKNEDGSTNWFNFFTGGSWGNLAMIIIICSLIVGSVLLYRHDILSIIEFYKSNCVCGVPFLG